jgi:hypothetical protein
MLTDHGGIDEIGLASFLDENGEDHPGLWRIEDIVLLP